MEFGSGGGEGWDMFRGDALEIPLYIDILCFSIHHSRLPRSFCLLNSCCVDDVVI